MIVAGSDQQQQLGGGCPAVGGTLHQQRTDCLGTRRAAGLARGDDGTAEIAQPRRQRRELGALARPFAALEGDEAPGVQERPQIR
jgi:hypothetical protein